ncbi:MAG TPA: UvrB/UvrC motif-containing protein, partial [Fibrobacteria bacterium]|nr:UvrB/UvrC motif-containing protein [Fibrobacteria bacterium]
IQTIGRAARHLHGKVLLYGDVVTDSIRDAVAETRRRRERQEAYNTEHGITPRSVIREIHEHLQMLPDMGDAAADARALLVAEAALESGEQDLDELRKEMDAAAASLEFERAALLRDRIRDLEAGGPKPATVSARKSGEVKKGRARSPRT